MGERENKKHARPSVCLLNEKHASTRRETLVGGNAQIRNGKNFGRLQAPPPFVYAHGISRARATPPRAGGEGARAQPKLDPNHTSRRCLRVVNNLGAQTGEPFGGVGDGHVGVQVLLRVLVVVAAAGDLHADAAGNLLRVAEKKARRSASARCE